VLRNSGHGVPGRNGHDHCSTAIVTETLRRASIGAVPSLGALALWGLAIGASLVVGTVVAARTSLPSAVAEFVTAFGGGVLLAAITLELVPAADEAAGPAWTAGGLISALVYVAADAWLTRDETRRIRRWAAHGMAAGRAMDDEMSAIRSGGDHAQAARGESIAVGLFIDGVPESLALGLTVAAGEVGAALAPGW
jgi:zinc transporter, ZIP family